MVGAGYPVGTFEIHGQQTVLAGSDDSRFAGTNIKAVPTTVCKLETDFR